VFRQQVTQPLAGAIGNFFAGFRAEGGPVGAGSAYVVGEKGPELFVPGASGSIIPNGAASGGGKSGPSVNVTYNIASGVSRADLAPILEQERKRLKAEIPDMVRRGGSYRSAFA
jgi:phage-related minor tail protein